MIICTNVESHLGKPSKGENGNTIYTQFNFSSDVDIPELDYKAGDVIETYRATYYAADQAYKIANDWVVAVTARIEFLKKSVDGPYIMDLSAYQPTPPDDAQLAQRAYQQARQELVTLKDTLAKDVELGLATEKDVTDQMATKLADVQAKQADLTTKTTAKLVAEDVKIIG